MYRHGPPNSFAEACSVSSRSSACSSAQPSPQLAKANSQYQFQWSVPLISPQPRFQSPCTVDKLEQVCYTLPIPISRPTPPSRRISEIQVPLHIIHYDPTMPSRTSRKAEKMAQKALAKVERFIRSYLRDRIASWTLS